MNYNNVQSKTHENNNNNNKNNNNGEKEELDCNKITEKNEISE